jgi:hypothetical protein
MSKGIRNFHISFGEEAITHYGGLFQIHKFCQKLKLKQLLQMYVRLPQQKIQYPIPEQILFMIYCIIAGILRIENTRPLQFNGVFKKLLGVETFPNPTTIRRFLHQLSPKSIRQIAKVHNLLQERLFFRHARKTSVIFDLDPTAITVYGKQQRSKLGYNPKKKGKRCYSLVLCFESNHQEFWLGSLRSGNVNPIRLARAFLKECIDKLPESVRRIRIRADSAFFSYEFTRFLDENGISYTIEAQPTNPLQRIAYGLKYHPYKKDWEVADFNYQSRIWKIPQRFVVQRRPLPEDPEEKSQLSLFTIRGYGYRALITNLRLKPRHVWNFHNQRAKGAELNIKELKNSYPLTKIPTQSYTANIAYLQILLFAFNLVNWFKRLCLPKEFRYKTLRTIRQDLIVIPARLVRIGRSNILKLPAKYPYQKLFYKIAKNIESMNF